MAFDSRLSALRKQLMGGADAAGALEGMKAQQAEAEALRGTPDPTMGKRSGYTSPLQNIAAVGKRLQGTRDMRRIGKEQTGLAQAVAQAQAEKTMYGAQTAADATTLAQSNLEQKVQADALEKQRLQQNYERQQGFAENKFAAEQKSLTAEPDTWYNAKTKQYVNAGRTKEGMRDIDQNVPFDSKDFMKLDDHPAFDALNPERLKGMDGSHKRDVVSAYSGIDELNEINSLVGNFSSADVAALTNNRALFATVLTEQIAPEKFTQWAKSNLKDYSPEVRKYLEKVNQFSAEIRNQAYGSALTKPEIVFSNMWLPSDSGIGLEERQSRMDNQADKFIRNVRNVSKVYGTDFVTAMPEYKTYSIPGTDPAAGGAGGNDELDDAMNQYD